MAAAPQGADAIVRAHEFSALMEATLKTGYRQWSQEFARCLDHYRSFVTEEQVSEEDVYPVFVTSELYEDTYQSIRRPPMAAKFILLELPGLASILDTSTVLGHMKHAHLRRLLNGLFDDLQNSSSLADFRSRKEKRIADWQKDVLMKEKTVFLSIKSYQAIRQRGQLSARDVAIFQMLQRDEAVQHYEELLGEAFTLQEIGPSLELHNLASAVTEELYGHRLVAVIPMSDLKATTRRILMALEEKNG